MLTNPFRNTSVKVYLVGAGPGDPDLLTVKAVRTLGLATIVLHDALVSADVLGLISPQARIVNVGKRCGRMGISQSGINELLIRYAISGHCVVRLKSGDPLIFGRAGEELEALAESGIDVEIVPGVTAAVAAAAAMKIPLTDRRIADQILFVSAHHALENEDPHWRHMAQKRMTLVIYMPGSCAGVAEKLRQAGFGEATPCTIISKVSSPAEQAYHTTLASLEHAPLLPSPSVLIVGDILSRAASLQIRSLCAQGALYTEASTVPPA